MSMSGSRFDQPKKFTHFDTHHWADWVELCCVEDLDGTTSRKEMEKRFHRSVEGEKSVTLMEVDLDLESVDEEDEDIVVDDRTTEKVADWFDHLHGRSVNFGDAYPFAFSSDGRSLTLKEQLSDTHRLYLAMLLMANLHYFQELQHELSADFERLSECALRRLLPSGAEVHVFGKGPAASSRYSGIAWDRIRKLAVDLRAKLLGKEEDFPPQSSGDGGLDLVAWVPWLDAESGSPAIFGQCGCTPDWKSKQHSSKPDLWCANKMSVLCPPLNAVFSPYFLRKEDGTWQRPMDMGPYIHVDRLRLAHLLAGSVQEVVSLASFGHVNAVIADKAEPC